MSVVHPEPGEHKNAEQRRHDAVRTYYKATAEVAAWLSAIFKAAFPDEYEVYADAFKAGSWMGVEEDPGPFLMRVIVWKLSVHLHVDGGDGGSSRGEASSSSVRVGAQPRAQPRPRCPSTIWNQ